MLKMIGEFLRVDRSYPSIPGRRPHHGQYHEWYSQEIPRISGPSRESVKMICLGLSVKCGKLDFLHIPDVEKLPEEACAEKNEFRIEDIKSLIIVPIAHGGSFDRFWPRQRSSTKGIEL